MRDRLQADQISREQFLNEYGESLLFRLDDTGKNRINGLPNITENEIESFNSDNFGIFFAVNQFIGNTRRESELSSLRALYCDLDVSKDGELSKSQIKTKKEVSFDALLDLVHKPHYIIETKNGLQPLWLIDCELGAENLRYYKNLNKNIVYWSVTIGALGDRVYDGARVLRLPDTLHCKDPEDKFLVRVYKISGVEEKYTLSEMYSEFSNKAKESVPDYMSAPILNKKEGSSFLPDVSYGSRDNELTRIVGSLTVQIPPQLWEDVVWPRLVKWNDEQVFDEDGVTHRPLTQKELRKTFESICRKEALRRDAELIPESFDPSNMELLEKQILEDTSEKLLTGYTSFDKHTGGLKYRNTYLVAGLEKSGKSSWLIKMLYEKMMQGIKVGIINTELSTLDFIKALGAHHYQKEKDEISYEEARELLRELEAKRVFYHKSYGDIAVIPSIKDAMDRVDKFLESGIEILVFDNITTFSNSAEKGQQAWEALRDAMAKIFQLTKGNKIITFLCSHVNPSGVVISNKPSKSEINKMGEDPYNIFMKGSSYVLEPNTHNIYGGGMILSQVSGIIMIWRPHQKSSEEQMAKISGIIITSFRHCRDKKLLADFDGAKGLFEEVSANSVKPFNVGKG